MQLLQFFVAVEANWNRNQSTRERKLNKSRGVLGVVSTRVWETGSITASFHY